MKNEKNNYILYYVNLQNEPQELPVNCTVQQLGEIVYLMTVKNYVVTVKQIKTAQHG
jgi:hypothetical protein